MAKEKVPSSSKDINRAIRSHARTQKSINIDRIRENNHYIAAGLDMQVKVKINRGPAGDYLGALNAGARILINGKAGRFVATNMSDGEVLVNGDVKTGAGTYLQGGLLSIKGDCSGSVGDGMKGGIIIIDGNVDGAVGEGMYGGQIYVSGDIKGPVGRGMRGGEIFTAGEAPELEEDVKVKPVTAGEVEEIRGHHKRFKFKRFQTPESLKEFRKVEPV